MRERILKETVQRGHLTITRRAELVPISETATGQMQKHAETIAKMTDHNDHSGAVLYLAQKVLKDRKSTKIAKAIVDIHEVLGGMPFHLGQFRSVEFWKGYLEPTAKKKLSPEDYDLIMGSFY